MDPIDIATEGYAMIEEDPGLAIATHGYVTIFAAIVAGVVAAGRKLMYVGTMGWRRES